MAAKKTTILTADDDPQLLRLVARNLELEDYDVLTASDGKQALEQIEAHAPDLVLLDVMMPKMDGFTVCQRVREFSSVPIIMNRASCLIKPQCEKGLFSEGMLIDLIQMYGRAGFPQAGVG